MAIVIKLSQLPGYLRSLSAQFRKAGQIAITQTAAQAVGIAMYRVIPSRSPQPVDRGNYKRSWKFVETAHGAIVYNDNRAAAIVEHGARADRVKPGKIMRAAIREWAQRKGMAPKPPPKPKRPRPGWVPPSAEKQWESLVWAIVMAMKKHGIMNHGKGWGINKELETLIPPLLRKNMITALITAKNREAK